MPQIFISYSTRNKKRALKLADELKNRGVEVWFDDWDLPAGHKLLDSIYSGIKESDYFVLILTKNSVKSNYVKEELDIAKQEEIEKGDTKIIPLLFEKCEIPIHLKTKKYINFRNFDRGMEELIKNISKAEKTIALDIFEKEEKIICQNIDSKSLIESGTTDDLFLSSLSFEDRSLWTINNYPLNSIRNIILFDVGEFSGIQKETWHNSRNISFSREASSKLVKNGKLIHFQWNNPNSFGETENIKNLIQDYLKARSINNISIDVSAFPNPYLLKLLQILKQFNSSNLKLFYTSPNTYFTGAGSMGIAEIQNIPYGFYDKGKPNLLIIFPGFFQFNVLEYYEICKPDKIIMMIPKSDELIYNYESFIRTFRDQLLSDISDVIIKVMSGSEPITVANELESLKSEYLEYNWWVVPQGTKLQNIGIHIFSKNNNGKISYLIWVKPMKYLTDYYSDGIGQTWLTSIKQ